MIISYYILPSPARDVVVTVVKKKKSSLLFDSFDGVLMVKTLDVQHHHLHTVAADVVDVDDAPYYPLDLLDVYSLLLMPWC